ncbi:MAG TPA: molybdopterin-binding protein [bacterium]|jgi:molybdenum cofactor synthesis domain-containing protein
MVKSGKKFSPPKIHLAAIGNELLNAEIRDSNLAWLIKNFTGMGGAVLKANIIPDDFDAVASEITDAKRKKIDYLVTTGGLGPTDDDATFLAIAYSLKTGVALNRTAMKMIKERLEALKVFRPGLPQSLNRERKSQAYMPPGSEPLFNPVGVAPGLRMMVGNTMLISLPGVPSEMKGIMTITLGDFWEEKFRDTYYVRNNVSIWGIPEAELAGYIRRANAIDPDVYIKSRLRHSGKRVPTNVIVEPQKLPWFILLHFSTIDQSRKFARNRINAVRDSLLSDLRARYKYPYHIG